MYLERAGTDGPQLLLVHGSIVPGWQTWEAQRPLSADLTASSSRIAPATRRTRPSIASTSRSRRARSPSSSSSGRTSSATPTAAWCRSSPRPSRPTACAPSRSSSRPRSASSAGIRRSRTSSRGSPSSPPTPSRPHASSCSGSPARSEPHPKLPDSAACRDGRRRSRDAGRTPSVGGDLPLRGPASGVLSLPRVLRWPQRSVRCRLRRSRREARGAASGGHRGGS